MWRVIEWRILQLIGSHFSVFPPTFYLTPHDMLAMASVITMRPSYLEWATVTYAFNCIDIDSLRIPYLQAAACRNACNVT